MPTVIRELRYTPTDRHLSAAPAPTMEVNVWPRSQHIPGGQVEVITPRGRSVAFSHSEWVAMVEEVGKCLK